MTAFDTLRAIAADPDSLVLPGRGPTAREVIEARLGRKLPPTPECPPDIQQAIKLLAIQRIRNRLRAERIAE
ncbi:hypothetical protein WAF00_02855 [Mameliella alba]|uniref:hypothetical protein n=1 Tax=Mameliella alba TaxID=561184 RepID=UPI001556F83F|nr:hypothetical protein [Mameliella alba]